jgi:glutathione S-transferase
MISFSGVYPIHRLFSHCLIVVDRESGAILTYLVEKYDSENKISVSDPREKYHQLQWVMFQMSGQGSVHLQRMLTMGRYS